jgi:hypothetical protein
MTQNASGGTEVLNEKTKGACPRHLIEAEEKIFERTSINKKNTYCSVLNSMPGLSSRVTSIESLLLLPLLLLHYVFLLSLYYNKREQQDGQHHSLFWQATQFLDLSKGKK